MTRSVSHVNGEPIKDVFRVEDFRERHETDGLARTMFYDDVDEGKFDSLPVELRQWTLMPAAIRHTYRSDARKVKRFKPVAVPTLKRKFALIDDWRPVAAFGVVMAVTLILWFIGLRFLEMTP